MSNSNTNLQTQSSNALHNAIIEAGSKDRPPYVARGVLVAEGSSETTTEWYMENYKNVSQDIRDQLNAEAEAIQIIHTGIDNDIYSTVDACPNACEMWKAIERFPHQNHHTLKLYIPPHDTHTALLEIDRKAIVTSSAPTYDPEPTTVTKDEEMSKEKEIDKLMALISLSFKKIYNLPQNLRTSSNTSRVNQDNSLRINRGTGYDNQRAINVAGARENVGTLVVPKVGIQCYNCTEYGHVSRELSRNRNETGIGSIIVCTGTRFHEVTPDSVGQFGPIFDDEAMHKDETDDLDQERDLLASGNSEETKIFAKPEFLKKAQRANPRLYDIGCYNDNLALMLAPESDETIRLDKESRSKLSDLIRPFDYDKLNNLYDLFVPQREKSPEQHYFPRTSKMSHTSSNNEFSKESFRKQTTLLEKRMDESIPWDQKCKSSKELFKIKKSVDTIFDGVERCKQTIAKRTYFGNIDPFIQNTIEGNFCPQIRRINADLEKFHLCLNEEMVADLRYFNSLEHEVDTLKSQLETQKTQFLNEIDRLSREYYYADHMNAILGVYTDLDEVTNLQCDYLETVEKCEHLEKELSKSRTMSKSFESLQKHAINLELDLQHCKEKIKQDKSFKENQSNVFLKEREQYFEIQDLKAQLQDKGIAISELKKLIEKMKGKSVETNVSRPQLKSNHLEDRVMSNNSQGKKQEVEDHRRKFKFSNNKTSVTACNDSLNAKTSNVNFVCVTCGKCVLNDNHDLCVLHYINGVNSRTRQPMAVPVRTTEPKHDVNKSVATSSKKTVATDSTVKKSRNITRKLYEQVSKTCSWWYPKYTPSGYKWKPKSQKGNVNPNVSMPLGNASRTANILEHKTPRCSTVSNTPLSSNSFAARRDSSIHRRLWVLKAHDRKSQASN
ncbi:hypothetical protein Tco_1449980 [Tanacetum coccineum]